MFELIEDIIKRFGGRISGSQEAKDAQHYFKSKLEAFCDTTEIQTFQAAIEAKFHSLKLFTIVFAVNMVVFWFSPIVATYIAFLNSLIFIGHFFTYYAWLDFLYKKKESFNIIGTVNPSSSVKSTIIIAGHIDSVYEFKWWYKLKQVGAYLSILSGLLYLFQFFFFVAVALLIDNGVSFPLWVSIGWGVLLFLSPSLVVFYDMHDKRVKVDGAIDNLSGVAIAYGVAKAFSDKEHKLKHTSIQAVSFGCEEIGLKGSKAYAKKVKKDLGAENVLLINVDSIKSDQLLTLITSELNTGIKYDKSNLKKMEQAFKTTNIPFTKNILTVGATDGTSFMRQGIQAMTIIGIESDRLDFTYHNRLDNSSNLDPKALEALKKVIVNFVEEWDRNL